MIEDNAIYAKCVGAIFTKVNPERFKLYSTYGGQSYYYHRYGKYYGDAAKPNGAAL